MNENGGRSTNILLTVIGIATLLVVVTGATFAYFASVITGDDTATSVYIKAASDGLTVTQLGGEDLTLKGIYPRTEAWGHQTFGFTVEADESTTDQNVSFEMKVTKNDFIGAFANDIQYEFKKRTVALGDEGNDAKVTMTDYIETTNPTSDEKVSVPATGTTTTIATGTRPHNKAGDIIYDLYVYYVERDTNQNDGTEREISLKVTGKLAD